MRVLAIAKFRLLTIVRTGTPIFAFAVLPVAFALIPLSMPEPKFREFAEDLLPMNAFAALVAWILHAVLLAVTVLATGKVKTPHNDVMVRVIPDLMETAPVTPSARFHGETLGTLGAGAVVHVCCLPLLAAVATLSPWPAKVFAWIEVGTIALLAMASAGAAWQRRAPRTKYSGSRGPRNALVFAILVLVVLRISTHWEAFRDSLAMFVYPRTSMQAWAEVARAADNPLLLFALLSIVYAGNLAYYYVSATRKRAREN